VEIQSDPDSRIGYPFILSTQRIVWQQVLRSRVQVQVRVLKLQIGVQVQVPSTTSLVLTP